MMLTKKCVNIKHNTMEPRSLYTLTMYGNLCYITLNTHAMSTKVSRIFVRSPYALEFPQGC